MCERKMSSEHDKICAICWEDVNNPSVTLNCGHRFHYGCLSEWSKRSNECPMCREQFISRSTSHDNEMDNETEVDFSIYWQDENDLPHGYQIMIQSLVALSTTITILRFLALFFPVFVHRLFCTQIEAGKHLQTYFSILKQFLRPYLSTICLGMIVFSTPYARHFWPGAGE